jgi:hypothetical protein
MPCWNCSSDLRVSQQSRRKPSKLKETMFRLATFVALQIALLSVAIEPTKAAEYGTARGSEIKTAVSAITRNNAPGTDVRLWHKADIDIGAEHVRF